MPLIILGKVDYGSVKGGKRAINSISRKALRDTAKYWHQQVFPRHFQYGNTYLYNLRPRAEFYKKALKKLRGQGVGKFTDLVLSGRSVRAMRALATITGTAKSASVTMRPPSYFTNPDGKNQPDKVDEVLRMSAMDLRDVRQYFANRVALLKGEFQ